METFAIILLCVTGTIILLTFVIKLPFINNKFEDSTIKSTLEEVTTVLTVLFTLASILVIMFTVTMKAEQETKDGRIEVLHQYLAGHNVAYRDIFWIITPSPERESLIKKAAQDLGVSPDKLRRALSKELRCFWAPEPTSEGQP